jgi:hypothetical protein
VRVRYAAIDTGTSRNATALAIVEHEAEHVTATGERIRDYWSIVTLRHWQGSPGRPLDIRNVVGPEAAQMVRAAGLSSWATDAIELAAIKLVSAEYGLSVRVQGGELFDVYRHTRTVVHERRFGLTKLFAEDEDAAQRVVRGLSAIQAEPRDGRLVLSLPNEGDSHHDEASAVLRALWHGSAGRPIAQVSQMGDEEMALRWRSPRAVEPVRSMPAKITEMSRHPRAR